MRQATQNSFVAADNRATRRRQQRNDLPGGRCAAGSPYDGTARTLSRSLRAGTWVLSVCFVAANIAGYSADLYDRLWWYDKFLHAGTSLTVTLWLGLFLADAVVREKRLAAATLIASAGLALGVGWEVAEWLADAFSSEDLIKGKTDTILDLIVDAGGAMAAGLLVAWFAEPSDGSQDENGSSGR